MPARLYLISGQVQGVGYRNFARQAARALGIHGYAKNLFDGRVEVHAQGPSAALDEFAGSLARGPLWGEVRHVEVREAPMLHLEGFHIR